MYDQIKTILAGISRGTSHGQKSPHKLIFLLTLTQMCNLPNVKNHFQFTPELDSVHTIEKIGYTAILTA